MRPSRGWLRTPPLSVCRGEHLLAFSYQTRNFCPSCQVKRAALFAEHVVEDVLSDVPHRHVVLTVPKVVRGLFERVPWWDQHALSEVFRRLVLRELRRAGRLREETESMLLSWQHLGFHVHAGEPVLADDTDRLEHLARSITRAPLRLDAITPLDAARVVVRTPPDPQTGSQRLELDVLEMIRRQCAQIPAPRQHLVRYYGWYSHRARGVRGAEAVNETSSAPSNPRGRSWARLLRKIFEVDPLLCPQCNVETRLVSVIQTPTVIDGILGHLWRIGGNDPHEGTAQRGPPVG